MINVSSVTLYIGYQSFFYFDLDQFVLNYVHAFWWVFFQ